MADYTITIADVRDGFSTTASDTDITNYILIADQADTCMDNKGVPDEIGQQLKILYVRHLCTMATMSGGAVTSERAVSGASRSYAGLTSGDGTGYLDTLRQIDSWGCVYTLANNNGMLQLRSVGRRVC